MNKLLYIGCGGFIGSILRYLMTCVIHHMTHGVHFPYGTFIVNMLGCFLIGYLSQLLDSCFTVSTEFRLFLLVGVLGSFTTFSTFSNETLTLLNNEKILIGIINLFSHMTLGLSGVMLGRTLASVTVRLFKPFLCGG